MLNLVTTNDIVRIVTSHAVDVDVVASYIDTNLTTFTPDTQRTQITTATTTTIVSAPAASTYRNVKGLQIANRDATDSVLVTVQFYNGATAYQLREQLLPPGVTLTLDDVGRWNVNGNVPRITQQAFTAAGAGTYTTPVGCKAIFVELVGGGGGGGGCADAATNGAGAGGGGAGEYACKMIVNPNATYAYTVGALGGGAAAGANPGTAGGTTDFGTGPLFSAAGGQGGLADTVATLHVGGLGGLGGTGGVAGDLNVPGNPGGYGTSVAAAQSLSGYGGGTKFGAGAIPRRNVTLGGIAAVAGTGAGGSGGTIISSGGDVGGGNGATGRVVVTEYY